jgi:hypothetical protein
VLFGSVGGVADNREHATGQMTASVGETRTE